MKYSVKLSQTAVLSVILDTFIQNLHDCLHELEYQTAAFLLWFGKRNFPEIRASLDYFEFKFKIQLWYDCLQNSFSPTKVLILATLCKEPADAEFKDMSLEIAIDRLSELKSVSLSQTSVADFKEIFNTSMISAEHADSDFLNIELNFFLQGLIFPDDWLVSIQTALSRFVLRQLEGQKSVEDRLINKLKSIEPEFIAEINFILEERRQVQMEESLSVFKSSLPTLFDKIFKDLQSLIKNTATSSNWLKHEKTTIQSVSSRLSDLVLPEYDIDSILKSWYPSVKSKVNIICTMFSNQRNQSQSHQSSINILANFYSLILYLNISSASNILDHSVTEHILQPILIEWYSAVEECFHQVQAEFDYEVAVCFISNLFLVSEALPAHREELKERLSLNISQSSLLHIGIEPLPESIPIINVY